MDESTKELEKYWDEFSQEYEEIQNESLVNIGQELREFLLAEKLLPARDFLLTSTISLIYQLKC